MHLLYLTTGLVEAGEMEVAVAYLRERPSDARPLVPDFERLGVALTDLRMSSLGDVRGAWRELGVRGMVNQALGDVRGAWRLRSLLRSFRPDIVHTHLVRANLLGIPLARLEGIPVVTSVHAIERHFSNPAQRPLYRALLSRARKVIAISDAVKEALVARLGLPRDRVVRIHYGLPFGQSSAEFSPDLGGLAPGADGPRIVTVGRLAVEKGQRYLVEAMADVRREFPSARAYVVGGDAGLQRELEAMIRRAGLDNVVVLTGFRPDAAAVAASADLFVLPSLSEGFGLVLLEAMAAGRPIVASDVTAISEIVVNGETGLLVPPGDAAALSAAMLRLLRDPEKARAMGEAGRERARRVFTVERMVEETQRVYWDAARG